jgi:carboxyl-terminal processing protease
MTSRKKQLTKLWLIIIIAVAFWTIGSGFYRNLAADAKETYKGLKLFADVIELVEKTYVDEVDTKQMIERAIHGMVHGLDPHSSLLLPDDLKDLQIDTHGEFTGIGIRITMKKGFVTVISPIEGTPAFKAGIQEGDKIIKVDGKSAKQLREAVKMIRGPKGTKVTITIIREGIKEPMDFSLVRDIIPIESIKSITLKPGYGYIWITNFRDNTTKDLVSNLETFESGEVPLKGLILDLRNNPGGLLNQAIEVADLFIEKGTFDQTEQKYPIVVLINGGSASASEIVAGALQDHKRALIIGTASFGKGSVQTVETLREGYGLKLTIARYYTPSGRSIQAKGIEPDIIVQKKVIDKDDKNALTDGFKKEKDLENHLDAKPKQRQDDQKEPKGKDDTKEKPDLESTDSDFDHLKLERLQSDNQVMRALDILLSYEIFKGING